MEHFSESQNEIRRMEMLKAALPYIPVSMQKFLNIYLGLEELFNAINMIKNGPVLYVDNSVPGKNKLGNTEELVNVLRGFCSPRENELIDMFFNMSKMMNMYDSYKDMFDMFKTPDNSGEETRKQDDTKPEGRQNTSAFNQMNPMAVMNMMNQFKGRKEVDDIFNNFLNQ